MRQFLRDIEDKNPTKINRLDAMWMASKAWNNVTEKTIENCFRKSGFKWLNHDEDINKEDSTFVDTQNKDCETNERWCEVTNLLNVEDLTFEEYGTFDDDLPVCGANSTIQTLSHRFYKKKKRISTNKMKRARPKHSTAIPQSMKRDVPLSSSRFLQKNTVMSNRAIQSIAVLDDALDNVTLSGKQTTLLDFF